MNSKWVGLNVELGLLILFYLLCYVDLLSDLKTKMLSQLRYRLSYVELTSI